MSTHIFHAQDGQSFDPVRQMLRELCPSGPEGCVLEDADLIVRYHGARYDLDAIGAIAFVEIKHGRGTGLAQAQSRTFGLLNQLCLDAVSPRYLGYYVANYDGNDPLTASWTVRAIDSPIELGAWRGDGRAFAELVAENLWLSLVPWVPA